MTCVLCARKPHRIQRLKLFAVYLHGEALHDGIQGEDDAEAILLAQHDAFHAGEGAGADAGPLTHLEQRVRFNVTQRKPGTQRFDIGLRQGGRFAAGAAHHGHHARYFKHPSYWRVDGKPYFSIYEMSQFLDSFGSIENARAALDQFRGKARAAGFPGLHLNAIVWGEPNLPGGKTPPGWPKLCRDLALDSLTSYTWVHHGALNYDTFPVSDYVWGRARYLDFWARAQKEYSIPYFPNAMINWDNSPRAAANANWTGPAGPVVNPVVTGNTPAAFRQSLEIIKQRLLAAPTRPKIITINAWNEWPEGSCLEPAQRYGYGYLEAVRAVFGGSAMPAAGKPE